MADIKTRQVNKGSIKTIDRAANLSSHIREATIRTKDGAKVQTEQDGRSASGYASDKGVAAAEDAACEAAYVISGAAVPAIRHARQSAEAASSRIDVKTKAKMLNSARVGNGRESVPVTPDKGSRITQAGRDTAKDSLYRNITEKRAASAAKVRTRSISQAGPPIKEGKTIKTARNAATKRITTQTRKREAAREAAIESKRTTERIKKSVQRTIVLTLKALRALIESAKALFLALVTGGWIVVLVIIVCIFFGAAFYFYGDESSANYTAVSPQVEAYTPIIQKYADEYGIPEYVELIKAVMMQESGGSGQDPMQAAEGPFNKKYPKKPNGIKDPDYSIRCGVQELKSVLEQAKVANPLDMEHIRLALQGYNYGNGYIPWAVKRDGGYTVENAAAFSDLQAKKHGWKSYGDKQYVAHVLRYYPYGNYNLGIGNTKITQVAAQQIGNKGGKKFWSWYGFKSRVEWCACFVSWCEAQCGYIKEGITPKFAACDDGAAWFKSKKQWQKAGYKPMPGDIIFFDWQGDGHPDHVGIVEKCDGNTVFTIEGNSSDQCKRCNYAVKSKLIYGFGVPKY